MNADRLLAHFERISDAPDAVDRLRRFILDLAVRGKLVPSEAAWDVTTVGSLGVWGSGGTPSKNHPEYYGGDIPWLVIGDLNDGVVTVASTHITRQGLDNSSAKLIGPGAVLIALYGSIGKLGITGIRCATNQAIAHCIPNEAVVCREYLFLLLRSMRDALLARGQGVAQQNISQKILKAEVVRLPPLAEQHRIVEKVDELMMLCDRLEASQAERETRRDRLVVSSLNRLGNPSGSEPEEFKKDAGFHLRNLDRLSTKPEHIKELRKAILNLAVRGKLVPQEEPWQHQTFSDICPFITSGSRGWAEFYSASGPVFIRAQNIRFGSLRLDDIAHVAPPATTEAERCLVKKGDVLIVITGAGVTTPALMDRDLGEAYVSQHVALARPKEVEVSPWLLLCLMATEGCRGQLVERAYGAGKPGLNLDNIRTLEVPLPPLAEQKRIVAKVDELMAICDQLEKQLDLQQKENRRLLEALLHEALEGVG